MEEKLHQIIQKLKDIDSGITDGNELEENYNNIFDDVENILNRPRLTRSQNKMVEILSLLKELVDGFPFEQSDTTDMSELESVESAEQQEQGLH